MSTLASSGLAKRDQPGQLAVSSSTTDTGRISWAPVAPITPLLVGVIGTPVFSAVTNINFAELLHFGDFGFLALPVVAILAGIIGNNFEAQAIRDLVKSTFSHNDREILAQAKKKIGLGLKLKMMLRLLSSPTILINEMDGPKMTHTKAELVRRNGSYYIEIETMNALATWDLALESVVPESVRESLVEAKIARDAKYFADRIREETHMRKVWMYENEEDFRYQRQRGALIADEEGLSLLRTMTNMASCKNRTIHES